jgi:hypothetical protein
MFRSRRAARRILAAGGAILVAGLPVGTHADSVWSSTAAGVTTLTYQSGAGLNLSPLTCGSSVGTLTATLAVSFATTALRYAGPATVNALFTSSPGACSNTASGFGQLSNATMSGQNAAGDTISCDLSLGGTAAIPGNPSGFALWDFNGPDNGPVACSIDGQPAGFFGLGMEGQMAITGVSASGLQATEVTVTGGLSFAG